MQAAQDDEDVRRIAELERNVPAGAELSFMDLPADVRARIMVSAAAVPLGVLVTHPDLSDSQGMSM
jgi:hypothetical protein